MTTMADRLLFISLWLRQPFRIAAVSPSGRALAALMTAAIKPDDGPVIELGAGTGVFTRALLARGVREQDLMLVEDNPEMADMLKQRFPAARVVVADAARLSDHYPFGDVRAGVVVSGLPLLSMPQHKVIAILRGAFALLRDVGSFYQFTYGFGCPVQSRDLAHAGLSAERVGWVAANLPPAAVYRFASKLAFS
jgi:phosphatidylethanolamine/phosphatidyl-N-methylethanolamine N-methyltransferase